MGLSKKPEPAYNNPQQPVKAYDDLYKTAVVDEQYSSQLGLQKYAAGYATELEYYQQILGENDEQSGMQINKDEVAQQWRHIEKLEVKLLGGVTPNFNSDNRRMEEQGALVLPACIVPNAGDMFIMTGLDHRPAVYSITKFTPKNISISPAYECEFAFQGLLTQDRIDHFQKCTVETCFYDQDQLKHGKHPVMATLAYNRKYDYLRLANELCAYYVEDFWSRELNTLLIPGQEFKFYDPWCAGAFTRVWETLLGSRPQRYMLLNVDDNQYANAVTVFELALDSNRQMENQLTVEFSVVHHDNFYPYPQTGGVRFSGVDGVMWPTDDVDAFYDLTPSSKSGHRNPFAPPAVSTNEHPRLFPLVTEDPYYVFTAAFYAQTEEQSIIEYMVREMIEEKPVRHDDLARLIDALPYQGEVERYYFTPFIVMLLRTGALQA